MLLSEEAFLRAFQEQKKAFDSLPDEEKKKQRDEREDFFLAGEQQDDRSLNASPDRILQILYRQAIDRIVRLESRALQREARKQVQSPNQDEFNAWADDFYEKLPGMIAENIGAIVRGCMEKKEAEIFMAFVGKDWADDSQRQIVDAITTGGYAAVECMADEWQETRGAELETRHMVRK